MLKYSHSREKTQYYLRACNKDKRNYANIYVIDMQVQGVAVGYITSSEVIRRKIDAGTYSFTVTKKRRYFVYFQEERLESGTKEKSYAQVSVM